MSPCPHPSDGSPNITGSWERILVVDHATCWKPLIVSTMYSRRPIGKQVRTSKKRQETERKEFRKTTKISNNRTHTPCCQRSYGLQIIQILDIKMLPDIIPKPPFLFAYNSFDGTLYVIFVASPADVCSCRADGRCICDAATCTSTSPFFLEPSPFRLCTRSISVRSERCSVVVTIYQGRISAGSGTEIR